MIKCFFKQLAGINMPKEARQLITIKVHEKSEAAYERMRQELLDVTNQYFLNNWDSCKEKWVTFLRDEMFILLIPLIIVLNVSITNLRK